MEQPPSDDESKRLLSQLGDVEGRLAGFAEYMENIRELKATCEDLIVSQHQSVTITITNGREDHRLVTWAYFGEYEEADSLLTDGSENNAYHQLLVYQYMYPDDAIDARHLVVCANTWISGYEDNDWFSACVAHLFADDSSHVFRTKPQNGSGAQIVAGELGPYVTKDQENGIYVKNASPRYVFKPHRFKAQHWQIDQMDDPEAGTMIESARLNNQLSYVLGQIRVFYKQMLSEE